MEHEIKQIVQMLRKCDWAFVHCVKLTLAEVCGSEGKRLWKKKKGITLK